MFWLILLVFSVVIEVVTGTFIVICLGVGALFGYFAQLCGASLSMQIIIAIVCAAIATWYVPPIARKYWFKNIHKTNIDSLIGQIAVVTEEIRFHEFGQVKIQGKAYRAKCDASITLITGSTVTIERMEGVTFTVKPIQQ